MIELIVIFFLCVLLVYEKWQNSQERKKMINALVAKNASEMRDLDVAGTTKVEGVPPDINTIPLDAASDEEFFKAVAPEYGKESS